MHVDDSFLQKYALYGFDTSLESESELQGAGLDPSISIALRLSNLPVTQTLIRVDKTGRGPGNSECTTCI